MFLKPLGLVWHAKGGEALSQEGAADMLWSILVAPAVEKEATVVR